MDKSKRRMWEYVTGLKKQTGKQDEGSHNQDAPQPILDPDGYPEPQSDPAIQPLKDAYMLASPPPQLDEYIRKGLQQGQHARFAKRRRKRTTGAAAVVLFITLFAALGLSPAFASFVERMTTQLLDSKDGLHIAAEQGYKQHIGKSVEHDGIRFEINDLIVDESRMVVYYSIKDKNGYDSVHFTAKWKNAATGEELYGNQSMGGASDIFSSSGSFSGSRENGAMEVRWKEDTPIPDKVNLSVTIHVPIKPGYQKTKQLDKEWKLSFSIRKDQIVAKQVYELNETVSLDGQNVTFLQATLLPTAIRLDFSIDPNNIKQLFAIEDLRLVDQNGVELKPLRGYDVMRNSFVESVSRPRNTYTVYFEGSLLANPESLHIVGSTIRALDKSKREIMVDTREKKLIKVPDERIKLVEVNKYPQLWEIEFELEKDQAGYVPPLLNLHTMITLEQSWLDPKKYGKVSSCSYSSSSEEIKHQLKCQFRGTELMGEYMPEPLIFRIYDYHYNKIHHPFRVMIK